MKCEKFGGFYVNYLDFNRQTDGHVEIGSETRNKYKDWSLNILIYLFFLTSYLKTQIFSLFSNSFKINIGYVTLITIKPIMNVWNCIYASIVFHIKYFFTNEKRISVNKIFSNLSHYTNRQNIFIYIF